MIKLDCIFDLEKNHDQLVKYRIIYSDLRNHYGTGQYRNFNKYDGSIFSEYNYKSQYARTIHTGKIKEGIELTELELSMICDDGFSHFGGSSAIYPGGSFKVEIYTD